MRVGFDVSPLERPHSRGIARLVGELARAVEARADVELVRLAPRAGEGLRAWRQGALPRAARELALDGIHAPLSAFPLRGPGWRVQTVHELPWRHGVAENTDLRHRMWAALGPLRADRVVTASEHVARDLRRRALPGAGCVRVCPWGVGPPFADEPPPGVVDEVVLQRYRLPQDPLVLCLDAVRPKKDLAALLHGAAEALRGGLRLHVLVSGEHTPQLRKDLGLVARLGISRHVSTPGPLPEEDLPALLRLASVVPVLSRSEGFSFPVLEALASGTPVVVPRGSAQEELAGSAGIAVEREEPASVAAGLARALEERETGRAARAARAAEFTWARCAERIVSIWREIA